MSEIVVPSSWRDRFESLAGRRRDLRLVGGAVAVLVIGALMLWSRGAPAQIAPPAVAPSPSETVSASVLVHVAGAVRRPGLYELPAGARVADAIDAARGPRPAADLNAVNLAEVVADGTQVLIPARGEALPPAAPTPGAAGPEPIGLNSADQAALEAVPGLGPVKAAAIISFREEVGGFSSLDQLLDVTGIGPATLEAIKPYLTL